MVVLKMEEKQLEVQGSTLDPKQTLDKQGMKIQIVRNSRRVESKVPRSVPYSSIIIKCLTKFNIIDWIGKCLEPWTLFKWCPRFRLLKLSEV